MPKSPVSRLHQLGKKVYNRTMTLQEKKRLRNDFFDRAGPNARAFAALFDHATDLGFYIKDNEGRIIALNPLNCKVCNFKSQWDAVGLRSVELFPKLWGEDYTRSDRAVLDSGKPSIGDVCPYSADGSDRIEIKDIHPLHDKRGKIIGTACSYRFATGSPLASEPHLAGLKKAFNQIQAHYADELTIGSLAATAGLSPTTFKRTFTQVFGIAPGKLVQKVRLNAARKLLETTDKLITDIAIECGFYDQSHFIRIFSAERGITPGEYRRRHAR